MTDSRYDIIILGGGPAGMTAALYAAKANLQTLLLERSITGGLVNSTYLVENFPAFPRIHGMELMNKMRAHIETLPIDIEELCDVHALNLRGTLKRVQTEEKKYTAPAIILATGRTPIPLETATESDQVHFCAICDGAPYAGKRILVVGGGNSAFDESLYLLTLGVSHITLIEAMPCYFAAQSTQNELFSSGKVTGYTNTRVHDLRVQNGHLTGVLLAHADGTITEKAADGVFVFLGQRPNNELFADCLTLSEQGYIKADTSMQTSIPGVFSAGDINEKPFRQITTAISDGTVAALSAERYLRALRS